MFSLGIFIFLIAVALGALPVWQRVSINLDPPKPIDMTPYHAAIDQLTPLQSVYEWKDITEQGVNRQGPPPHIANREIAARLNLLITLVGVMGVVGLASTIAAFFVGPKR
jgi:hypothetical protein